MTQGQDEGFETFHQSQKENLDLEAEETGRGESSGSSSAPNNSARGKGKEIDPLERGFERLFIGASAPVEVRVYFRWSYFLLNLTP
jgi:hypothetical protein